MLHDDACRLSELAERYLHSDIRYNIGTAEYTVHGLVRLPEDTSDDTPADRVRARLLLVAEQFIAALEPAGWHLTDAIDLQFRTEVDTFAATLAGEVVIPSRQACTSLVVDVRLFRPEHLKPSGVTVIMRAPERQPDAASSSPPDGAYRIES